MAGYQVSVDRHLVAANPYGGQFPAFVATKLRCLFLCEVKMSLGSFWGSLGRRCGDLIIAAAAAQAGGPFSGGVELFGLTLRREHPLPFGRGVALPLLDEALLMSFEVGDALSDLVAL